MSRPQILAFAGSTRRESFNCKLVKIGADAAREAGADVTLLDLADFQMPLYNGDLEASNGLPATVVELKKLFLKHDGLLISCPEYNSSITPLLKNTIDWVSRPSAGEGPLAAYKGKVAALMSASPGRLGGLRGLVHVRAILGNIGVLVLPDQTAVSEADQAFTDDGRLKDEKRHASIENLGRALAETLKKLGG
jgi:chromate reductase, NAD(P)H dehydrogenase (quinone)